jgi:hypothetical protein
MSAQANHVLVKVDGVEKMFHRGSEDIHDSGEKCGVFQQGFWPVMGVKIFIV